MSFWKLACAPISPPFPSSGYRLDSRLVHTLSIVQRLLRRAVFPPAYEEQLSPAQWNAGLGMRLVALLASIVTDIFLVVLLRHAPGISQQTLRTFAAINIALLMVDALVTVGMLRFPSFRRMNLLVALGSIEVLTIIVWVQASGSLSSYFVLVNALVMVTYRIMFSYRAGMAVFLAAVVFHAGTLVLESLGVLRPEALFLSGPSALYEIPLYRASAATSLFTTYVFVFLGANTLANSLRTKDQALAEVLEEAARAAEEAKHGRLTGSLIDGEYALGELIGRGGMGEVYLARRVSDERTVAVKVLHAHLLDDEEVRERFRREAEIAACVPAEYIAQVLGFGYDRRLGVSYIAMEYLVGEDLAAYLRRHGIMDEAAFIPLASKIAEAIDAAHEAGVVHRDIKPQNLFLTYEGARGDSDRVRVRILDFGVSKVAESMGRSLTQTFALMGTPGYLSPEQAMGARGLVGPASDRFSFAAVVYRALTGRAPFSTPDLIGAIQEVLKTAPAPPTELNPKLSRQTNAVMAIGLAKRPEDRYPSARALVQDLRAALAGELDESTLIRAGALLESLPAPASDPPPAQVVEATMRATPD